MQYNLPLQTVPKAERFLFVLALFVYFMYFGTLSVSLYFQLPNQVISAVSMLSVFVMASILFISSLYKRSYYKFDLLSKLLILYILYYILIMLFYDESSSSASYNPLGYGYMFAFKAYSFIAHTMAPFLLFLLPQGRFEYLAKKPMLIFIPSTISAILFISLWGDMIASDFSYILLQDTGVSRHLAKFQFLVLFSISIGIFVFSTKIIQNILSIIGMLIAFYGFYISGSQSNIVSAAFVIFVATIISTRKMYSFIRAIIINLSAIIFVLYFFIYSKTFDRILSTIFGMSDQILLGQGGDVSSASRIDLIYQGLQKFMESPIIGGTPYLEGDIYTHFFIVDTMMGMGIFGIVILAVYFTTIFRVYIFSYKSLDDSKIWILLIASCFFSQQFFHGNILSIISFSTSIFISIDMIRNHSMNRELNG